jgi:hypothetical protein
MMIEFVDLHLTTAEDEDFLLFALNISNFLIEV